jgi:hypothetical protein
VHLSADSVVRALSWLYPATRQGPAFEPARPEWRAPDSRSRISVMIRVTLSPSWMSWTPPAPAFVAGQPEDEGNPSVRAPSSVALVDFARKGETPTPAGRVACI